MFAQVKITFRKRLIAFIINIIGTAVILNGIYGFDVSLIQNIEITSVFFIWNFIIHHIIDNIKEWRGG